MQRCAGALVFVAQGGRVAGGARKGARNPELRLFAASRPSGEGRSREPFDNDHACAFGSSSFWKT